MNRFLRPVLLALAVAGAAVAAPVQAQNSPPSDFPANLRWDLVPTWIQWASQKADIKWPPNDGCAAAPVAKVLAPGQLIDRFGSEGGTFFSPRGESFKARAVPYVCKAMDYRVYKVLKPIPVKSCKAAAWFNEPGGAEQVQSADPAYKLVAGGSIVAVTYVVGGSSGPFEQCGRP
nr:TNT domain-containing protein [uncultured Rhodopila sp.]